MLYKKKIIVDGVEYLLAVNITGKGAPTSSTEALVGMLYMDTDTEQMYKCTSATNGVYTWEILGEFKEITLLAPSGEGVYACIEDGDNIITFYGTKGDEAAILRNIATPIGAMDATNKEYVDSKVAEELTQAKESGEFDGKPGTSVTVSDVSESTEDGGSNVVTFSDEKKVTIKNGSQGSPGNDGKTPYIKDGYWWIGETNTNVKATGNDGISPTISASKSGKVTTLVITDKNGTNNVIILDGADGTSVNVSSVNESSADGGNNIVTFSDGKSLTVKNGISPTVTASKSGKVTTITITDKNGTKTAKVNDGEDGKDGFSGVHVGTEATMPDNANVLIDPDAEGELIIPEVKQTTGDSTEDTMSQKAITELFEDGIAPDYIKAEAERVANNVQATRTAKSLVFPLMSDFHIYEGSKEETHLNSLTSLRYAGMGIGELKKRMHLDFVGYLGDFTWGAGTYTVEQVKKDITAVKKVIDTTGTEVWCVGNHDLNYGEKRDRLMTLDEMYAYIGANSDGVKPFDNTERCYGYVDFDNQRVRVIYLNTCDVSDWKATDGVAARAEWVSHTQMQWLADVALDFMDKESPAEWGIVIIGHHPLHYAIGSIANVMKILEAYRNGTAGSVSSTIDGITHTVSYDFTGVSERAEIICNIHGHNHNCGYSQISSTTMSGSTEVVPWLWRISIPNICANRYNTGYSNFESNETAQQNYGEFDESGNPVYWTKETGTAKATSFCVVNIDRKNKKIYAHIFGAGKDRVINYAESAGPTYTNQLDTAGYTENVKISSTDGNTTNATGCNATGFIPIPTTVTSHDEGQVVLYLANIEALPTDNNVRFAVYDSEKNFISLVLPTQGTEGYTQYKFNYWLGDDGYINKADMSTFIMNQAQGAAYVRISAPGIDGDSIITVNEPIE